MAFVFPLSSRWVHVQPGVSILRRAAHETRSPKLHRGVHRLLRLHGETRPLGGGVVRGSNRGALCRLLHQEFLFSFPFPAATSSAGRLPVCAGCVPQRCGGGIPEGLLWFAPGESRQVSADPPPSHTCPSGDVLTAARVFQDARGLPHQSGLPHLRQHRPLLQPAGGAVSAADAGGVRHRRYVGSPRIQEGAEEQVQTWVISVLFFNPLTTETPGWHTLFELP